MTGISVFGLGAMGAPIATRLRQAGHVVRGHDSQPAALQRWHDSGALPPGSAAAHPGLAVVICVSDEAAARGVLGQLLQRQPRGTLVIDHTTTSADWAREAARQAHAAGLRYCDAPLSGGSDGAAAGTLVAMLGADEADRPAVQALLAAYTRRVVHLGPPGAGQLCKMANQLAIAGVAAGLAEVQRFSRNAGLDVAQVLDVLSLGTAASVQLARLRDHLSEPDDDARRRFAWLAKDLALCASASSEPQPLVALWQHLWQQLDEDTR